MKPLKMLCLCAALLSACGGLSHLSSLESIRANASAAPEDLQAQHALAEAELLMRGGDAQRATALIAEGVEQAPDNLRLQFLYGLERELHGDLASAFDAFERVLELAARSNNEPLAEAMADVALTEIGSLDDSVPQARTRTAAILESAWQAGSFGDISRTIAAERLIDLAYRRGDLEEARALTRRAGCVTAWRVAGPIGPRQLLGFTQTLPPENDETLAARYHYGPGRGERDTREVDSRGCTTHVGNGPVGGAGVTYAEASFEVAETGVQTLRLETPNAFILWIDGEEILRVDRRTNIEDRVMLIRRSLNAGAHRVRIKLVSRHANPVLSLAAYPDVQTTRTNVHPLASPLHTYLGARQALVRGNPVAAREMLRDALQNDAASALLIVGAAQALNDPMRSSTVRHDEARRLLHLAEERDPQAWYPRLVLAQLEANEGRSREALAILGDAEERWPAVIVFPLQRSDLFTARGWHAQADAEIRHAAEIVEDSCRIQRARLHTARRQHRAEAELVHARATVACDARSEELVSTYVRRRAWPEAAAEVERLVQFQPASNPVRVLQSRLALAQAQGDQERVVQLLTALQEATPQATSPILAQADRRLAVGEDAGANQILSTAVEREPDAMISLRRVQRAIGGANPMQRFRRNGRTVLSEFETSGRTYEEAMVLVFDYTVNRVFEDGSMLELTHNIFRLQSQEAIDRMGEFRVPDGAHLLTLHTIKADGRRLEPDEIEGKETISFPSLNPGDYIEFEYIRPHRIQAAYPNGIVGSRFYFRNFETPFDHSSLTVAVPSSVELQVDPRGNAPHTEVTVDDGMRIYRWSVDESRPFRREPRSIPNREYFPSIYWGVGLSWPQYVESMRDVLSDRDPIDPSARRLVDEILDDGDHLTIEDRARRIFYWVLDNIEDTDNFFGLTPAMVAARAGNRTRVLHYLLTVADIPSKLALVRSFLNDATESEVADDDTYQNLLVVIEDEQDESHWIYAGPDGTPYGLIPPALAGQDALMLTPSADRVRVPEREMTLDRREIEVDATLHTDGNATLSIVETLHGSRALQWRAQLDGIPEAQLERRFENSYVASILNGAQLERLVITGRENPEQPLVLRYDVTMPNFARRSGDHWNIRNVFPVQLGPSAAPVDRREVTELLASAIALDVHVRITLPEGATLDSTPEDLRLTSVAGSEYTMTAQSTARVLTLQRHYRVPRMRLPVEDYRSFANFCWAATEAETRETQLRM